MSSVMYCYWLEKEKLFEFRDKLEQFCIENQFVFKLPLSYREFYEESRLNEHHINMQLFDIENKWLIRFLVDGYFIENNADKFTELIPCHYDNRTDIPKKDRKNKKYVKLVDSLIDRHHYLIVPVIDATVIRKFAWNKVAKEHKAGIIDE